MINADAEKVFGCKLEVSHIVTVGCSWTYCQGLPDILNQGWPALVARELNIPLVNLAVPGSGNDGIHRRTYEYIYENLPTGSKPLVIIGWSQYWRREGWYNHGVNNSQYNDYQGILLPKNKPSDYYEYTVLEYWNEEDFFRKTLLYKLSLINLLENHNIPFLMTEMADPGYFSYEELMRKFPEMNAGMKNSMKNYYEITRGFPKLPCGHEGIEANKIFATETINEIQNRFGKLTYVNKPYLHLHDYIKKSKTHQVHPEWCEFTL